MPLAHVLDAHPALLLGGPVQDLRGAGSPLRGPGLVGGLEGGLERLYRRAQGLVVRFQGEQVDRRLVQGGQLPGREVVDAELVLRVGRQHPHPLQLRRDVVVGVRCAVVGVIVGVVGVASPGVPSAAPGAKNSTTGRAKLSRSTRSAR